MAEAEHRPSGTEAGCPPAYRRLARVPSPARPPIAPSVGAQVRAAGFELSVWLLLRGGVLLRGGAVGDRAGECCDVGWREPRSV